MRYAPIKIVDNAAMAAGVVSEAVPLDQVFGLSIQATYVGSGIGGTLSLECSNTHQEDNEQNVIVPGEWVTMSGSVIQLTGPGSYIWNVEASNYLWVRLVYSESGEEDAILNAVCVTKGF